MCGCCDKGPHGHVNVQLERRYATGIKEKSLQLTISHQNEGKSNSVETSIDTAFLDVTIGTKQSSWTAEISLTNHSIQHTGVEVTAIFDKVFSSLYSAKLQKVSKVLLGLVQQKLAVTSQFDDHFLHKGEACQHLVFVVKGLKNNPLGLPNVIALNLVI